MKKLTRNGFTLVELMIATSVFAVILLVLTAGIMQISKVYYKGITSTQTQGVVRSAIEDVGQSLQLSGGSVRLNMTGGGYKGYCIGSRLYMYKISTQLTSASGAVFLGETVNNGCGTTTTLPPGGPVSNNAEKLQQKMRLARFDVTDLGSNLYGITIRVVAGDDNMLCSPSYASNTCNSGVTPSATELSRTDLQCKGIRGMQYCAVSEVTTTVSRRVE